MAKIKLNVSATVEEAFKDFIISRKTQGLADKTLQSYQSQLQAVAAHECKRWTLPCSKIESRLDHLGLKRKPFRLFGRKRKVK